MQKEPEIGSITQLTTVHILDGGMDSFVITYEVDPYTNIVTGVSLSEHDGLPIDLLLPGQVLPIEMR